MEISSFNGEYRFLSNFYISEIEVNGMSFPSVEAAYQAHKFPQEKWIHFYNISPSNAKKLGRSAILPSNWEQEKFTIMEKLIRKKFQIPELRERLLSTKDMKLIEGNYWHDIIWGVCNGVGENHLGKILMKIREEINQENKK